MSALFNTRPSALDRIRYLAMKVHFGDHESDFRWERFSAVFVNECMRARLVVDCGAEYGFYTHLALKANPECRVIAIEPDPERYRALSDFFKDDDRVDVYPYAVAAEAGRVCLQKLPGCSATSAGLAFPSDSDEHQFEAETVTLDGLLGEQVPDVIKMDIEGAEVFAVQGMGRILDSGKPVIFLEYHHDYVNQLASQGAALLNACLKDSGYKIFDEHGHETQLSDGRVILAGQKLASQIGFMADTGALSRNFAFSEAFSLLYRALMSLRGQSLVIFGKGSLGLTIQSLLPDEVVGFLDNASHDGVLGQSDIVRLHYDFVVISILGREKDIISQLTEQYSVPLSKIIVFNIGHNPTMKVVGTGNVEDTGGVC